MPNICLTSQVKVMKNGNQVIFYIDVCKTLYEYTKVRKVLLDTS